ncbi:MAG: Long-chain-fatty-acid--CoA ligase [uncultured Rubrobacteraceae bacterium]|uniref:Long-chain-fatty-acid--CoA ligase n=1 Tax=uncultured Rubrobacteraceae bacterium TaxID=349277 RepID=A0A6J4Q980_9ACTN|nr:MAG: Long-chain-fatty-acid--CoA ligase [uncultured Rubrobacteraceae bacterium]
MFGTGKPWLEVYEGHVEAETEIFEGSLDDFFRRAAEEHRGKTALTFYGTTFPFERLQALVEKMAGSLAAAGVGKGDRVALMLPNCPQYVISFFATVRLGAIVTQLNPMYVEREIEHILTDSGAETIVVFKDMYPRVQNVLPATSLRNVIVVDFVGEPEGLGVGHRSFGDFLQTDAPPAPPVPIEPAEDVAALQYTGGTTGVSKGAMLTHRNLVANVQQALDLFIDDPGAFSNNQKVMGMLPMFHIFGLTCVMLFGIKQGLNQVLIPKFDPQEVMNIVRDDSPVMFSGVPTMYMALNAGGADLMEYGFGNVRTYNSGGSALPVPLKRSFEAKVGRPLFEGYGLSEASPVTHFNPPFAGEAREGSIGVPVPSTDARIVDVETGEREMPVGEPGELIIKGPQVMKGYLNMPVETADTLRGGWLYTGDMARMDEDGYFFIVDRKKDMIVASGYNVYPREIEEVLFEHPDVSEAVAVGVPDEYRGESVKAFVVKKEGAAVTEIEIQAFCKERLAPYKAPKTVEFRETLPKSTVGKLLRRVLADEERERAGAGTRTATGAPPPPSPS